MDELRPCPFCGASGIFWDRGGMECPACAARGPANEKQRVCVTAWNTRPAEDAPQDDWLRAARMEALEAEVRRLQTIEDALLTSEAKTERYKAELGQVRADAGILEHQLEASQAEVARWTALHCEMRNTAARCAKERFDTLLRLERLYHAARDHLRYLPSYDGMQASYAALTAATKDAELFMLTPPAAPEADTPR